MVMLFFFFRCLVKKNLFSWPYKALEGLMKVMLTLFSGILKLFWGYSRAILELIFGNFGAILGLFRAILTAKALVMLASSGA